MEEGDSPTERYTTEDTFRILHSTQSEMFLWKKKCSFWNNFNLGIEIPLGKRKWKKNTKYRGSILHPELLCALVPTMRKLSATLNNVINRDMGQFHREANEFCNSKSSGCGHANLLGFFSMGFGVSFKQPNWVLYGLPTWLNKLYYWMQDGGLRR